MSASCSIRRSPQPRQSSCSHKRVETVAAMERELGLLYGTLTAVKGLVPEVAVDKAEEAKDLSAVADTAESIREYEKVLAQVVEADLTVESDTVDTGSDLKAVAGVTTALAKRMQQQADQTSAQANTIAICLVVLALVLGFGSWHSQSLAPS